jgi:hypothetical protein
MSRYNAANDDAQTENDATITITPLTAVGGVVDRVIATGPGQYGQSLGVVFNDCELIDGVLMLRTDTKGTDREKFKLFSWEQLGFEEGEDYTSDDAPERHAETFRETYKYELVSAVAELAGEEPMDMMDFITWENGGQRPSSSAKRLARLLTRQGADAVLDEDNINGWLDQSVELRSDLEGRRLEYFKQVRQGDEYEFHFPVLVDAATGSEITMNNQTTLSEPAPEAEAPTATDGGSVAVEADSGALPGPVEEFVKFVVNVELDDDAAILSELYHTIESDNSLTEAMVADVGGEEAVLQAIKSRR